MNNAKKRPYDYSGNNSLVETVFIPKGGVDCKTITDNVIVFFMTGSLKYKLNDLEEAKAKEGDMIFAPIGGSIQYDPIDDSVIMVLKATDNIVLSDYFSQELLSSASENKDECNRSKSLYATTRMWQVIGDIDRYINERIDDKVFYELKIKELLIIMRIYFSMEELKSFFSNISSHDTSFIEFINSNWEKHNCAEELAAAMNMSIRQFSSRFKSLTGMTPAKWLACRRADNLYRSIRHTDKPFRQICEEEGFNAMPQFSKFCKEHLGRTPSEIRNLKTLL